MKKFSQLDTLKLFKTYSLRVNGDSKKDIDKGWEVFNFLKKIKVGTKYNSSDNIIDNFINLLNNRIKLIEDYENHRLTIIGKLSKDDFKIIYDNSNKVIKDLNDKKLSVLDNLSLNLFDLNKNWNFIKSKI